MTDTSVVTGTILGRSMDVRPLKDAQLALILRDVRIATSGDVAPDRRVTLIGRITDLVLAAVTDPQDREWLEDQVYAGKLDFKELVDLATTGAGKEKTDVSAPKARRGRPPRAK